MPRRVSAKAASTRGSPHRGLGCLSSRRNAATLRLRASRPGRPWPPLPIWRKPTGDWPSRSRAGCLTPKCARSNGQLTTDRLARGPLPSSISAWRRSSTTVVYTHRPPPTWKPHISCLRRSPALGTFSRCRCGRSFHRPDDRGIQRRLSCPQARLGESRSASIFVVGCSGSGTTLVEQILASHPQIHSSAGELRDVGRICESRPAIVGAPGRDSFDALNWLGPDSAKAAASFPRAVEHAGSRDAATRIVDKSPARQYQISGIDRLALARRFPGHHLRPRPGATLPCPAGSRDTRRRSSGAITGNTSRGDSPFINGFLGTGDEQSHSNGSSMSATKAWWSTLQGYATRLIEFVGLEWDPACLQIPPRPNAWFGPPAGVQVRQPIYTQSVGRWWRNYATSLQLSVTRFRAARSYSKLDLLMVSQRRAVLGRTMSHFRRPEPAGAGDRADGPRPPGRPFLVTPDRSNCRRKRPYLPSSRHGCAPTPRPNIVCRRRNKVGPRQASPAVPVRSPRASSTCPVQLKINGERLDHQSRR